MAIAINSDEAILNIRTKTKVRDLIDSAANILGKNRSEFMLEVATLAAQDVILDRAFINVNETQFKEIGELLENPPPPNQALLALMAKPSFWEK
jgi:uncharacterized protein (DUF1778 family)